MDVELLKIEDVRKAVLACGTNMLLKALILTFFSSGQAQAEVLSLKGKHIKKIVNGIAIVNITRIKTGARYICFIGAEALAAIKEYKPNLKDDEYIFTQPHSKNTKPLYDTLVNAMFTSHSEKLGFPAKYFSPHRFRHYFETQLIGLGYDQYVKYWLGHGLGVESHYFKGCSIQEKMLDAYIKNLNLLTVNTDYELLQKQYDELKQNSGEVTQLKEQIAILQQQQKDTEGTIIKILQKANGIYKLPDPNHNQPV